MRNKRVANCQDCGKAIRGKDDAEVKARSLRHAVNCPARWRVPLTSAPAMEAR